MPFADLPPLFRSAATPVGSAERRDLQRRSQAGELQTIRPGVFVEVGEWNALGRDDRYLLTIRAEVPRIDGRFVVSDVSALASHGVSCLRPWPDAVHVVDPQSRRGQRRPGLVKHPGPLRDSDVAMIDGMAVTGTTRTCIDLALGSAFELAVAATDACLRRRLVSPDSLAGDLESRVSNRGRRAARRVLSFATAKSDSSGESWCRCRLDELGAPTPIQQKEFRDAFGRIGFVDFWFPSQGVVVEFDGDQKYLDARFRNGRSIEQVILDERKRERRLLAHRDVRRVLRVQWRDLVEPWRLRALLVSASVPVR